MNLNAEDCHVKTRTTVDDHQLQSAVNKETAEKVNNKQTSHE